MLPHNATAVIARNEIWTSKVASEPYECGWAREAIVFLRALDAPRRIGRTRARIEISPDGLHWVASGTGFVLPARRDGIAWAPVGHFGNWIRVAAELPRGASIKVLVTLHLKA
jgi:hypothetical protein